MRNKQALVYPNCENSNVRELGGVAILNLTGSPLPHHVHLAQPKYRHVFVVCLFTISVLWRVQVLAALGESDCQMGDQAEVITTARAAECGRTKAVSEVSELVQGLITDLGEDVSRDGLLGTPQVLPTSSTCFEYADSPGFHNSWQMIS